jgi:hypothetical protein
MESLLADEMETVLTDWCINDPDEDDDTKANNVIIGKPTRELRNKIVVSIHTNHPLGVGSDKDRLVEGPPRSGDERPLYFERESTGGARVEMMFGAIQIRIRQDSNHKQALNFVAVNEDRIKKAINRDSRLRVLEDDLGNTMVWLETYESPGYAAGGGDTSIFIRWIGWRAVIVSSNTRLT